MKELFAFADSEEFRRLLGDATRFPAVQGIVITVDPLWLHLVRLKDHLSKQMFERYMRRIQMSLGYANYFEDWLFPVRLWPRVEDVRAKPLDWSWRPTWWKAYQEEMGRLPSESPILVRVYLLPSHAKEELRRIEDYRFPVLFERREQARLCTTKSQRDPLVGGLSIGVG